MPKDTNSKVGALHDAYWGIVDEDGTSRCCGASPDIRWSRERDRVCLTLYLSPAKAPKKAVWSTSTVEAIFRGELDDDMLCLEITAHSMRELITMRNKLLRHCGFEVPPLRRAYT